jgi:hypothetical protein
MTSAGALVKRGITRFLAVVLVPERFAVFRAGRVFPADDLLFGIRIAPSRNVVPSYY